MSFSLSTFPSDSRRYFFSELELLKSRATAQRWGAEVHSMDVELESNDVDGASERDAFGGDQSGDEVNEEVEYDEPEGIFDRLVALIRRRASYCLFCNLNLLMQYLIFNRGNL
jgi:hypothetical protein